MPFQVRKNAKKSRGRPKKLNESKLQEMIASGYTDEQIARYEGVSRQAVAAARKRLGLAPNRPRGGRGCSKAKPDANYFNAVKKAMENDAVRAVIRSAIRQYLAIGEHKAWAATIIEPIEVPHPVPAYASVKINKKQIRYIANFEAFAALAGVVGVPGPDILELHRVIKSGRTDEWILNDLARRAVECAGYVPITATIADLRTKPPTSPELWQKIWSSLKETAKDFAERSH